MEASEVAFDRGGVQPPPAGAACLMQLVCQSVGQPVEHGFDEPRSLGPRAARLARVHPWSDHDGPGCPLHEPPGSSRRPRGPQVDRWDCSSVTAGQARPHRRGAEKPSSPRTAIAKASSAEMPSMLPGRTGHNPHPVSLGSPIPRGQRTSGPRVWVWDQTSPAGTDDVIIRRHKRPAANPVGRFIGASPPVAAERLTEKNAYLFHFTCLG